jgi:glycosyltransferase involved in cell wall biosynthesis
MAKLKRRLGEVRFAQVRFVYRGIAAALAAQMAEECGVRDIVDCEGHVSYAEAIALSRSAHLLLLLCTSEVERRDPYYERGHFPGKTFEYFAVRRPIICVPGDGASLDELLRETRAGTSLGDAHSVAGYLEKALGEWEISRDLPSLDNANFVARFSRRVGAQQMARVLNSVTKSPDTDEALGATFISRKVAEA